MEQLLKKYFGYDKFRPLQLDIINNVLEKKDSLVLMPTGGGKSLCFQIPALQFEGLTIVISPLISLMKDQVDALKANGINADFINSSLTPKKIDEIKTKIQNKEVKILYIAPERLSSIDFKSFLLSLDISLIAIDEAHCISEWGHEFRKDYRNLKFLKSIFIGVPIIALTATATPKVKDDILKQLNLNDPKVFISSFDRENLNLIVMKKQKTFDKILNLLNKHKNESAILYCFSRKDTENIAKKLKSYGHKALPYHAGLSNKIRQHNQEQFINDKINIIVATIAFGMGIDKPDVRLVIHHTFSKSVEGYYQEIGRAGRDGLPSDCILFYSRGDIHKQEFFINMIKDIAIKQAAQNKLDEMSFYSEMRGCRRKFLLKYFGEEFKKENCEACDICLDLPEIQAINSIKNKANQYTSYDAELFNELRDLRTKISQERDVPPFVVFGDTPLREMATIFPRDENSFLKINGVGQQKLNDFGKEFLNIINQYITINNIVDIVKQDNIINNLVFEDDEFPKRIRKTKKRKTKRGRKSKNQKIENYDEALFEELRSLRSDIAQEKNAPAFVIFSDETLREICHNYPRNHKEFLDIKGVGDKKLSQYGAEFLNIINRHLDTKSDIDIKNFRRNNKNNNNNNKKNNINNKINTKKNKKNTTRTTQDKTKDMIIKKNSIRDISIKRELTKGTVINHIGQIVQREKNIDINYLMPEKIKFNRIKSAFIELETDTLSPIFKHLKEKYSYDDIKLVKIFIDLKGIEYLPKEETAEQNLEDTIKTIEIKPQKANIEKIEKEIKVERKVIKNKQSIKDKGNKKNITMDRWM